MDGSEKGILWQSAPEENTGNSKSEYGASTDSEWTLKFCKSKNLPKYM